MHYYMFHKPYGCVCAKRDDLYPTVMDYFAELHNENLNPVGRLDRATTGLLFVTDDGVWNHQMTHPVYQKKKVYEFLAMGDPTREQLELLENGVMLRGAKNKTAPAKIEIRNHYLLEEILPTLHPEIQAATKHNRPNHPVIQGRIEVTEGKKHQVRRMLKAIRCCIIDLKRVSMGEYELDPELKPGEWKEIEKDDL